MIVALTFPMLRDATLRTFIEYAEKMQLWNPETYHRTESRCVLLNKAEVLFRSGDDPDALRGPSLSGAWLDECQKMSEDVYYIMIGRLRQHGKQGWLSATFTPGSPDHWTSKYLIGSDDPNVAVFRCSTKDNIFLPKEYFENLVRQYAASNPLRVRRELEGECVFLEGAEWNADIFEGLGFDDWPEEGVRVVTLDSSKGRSGKTGDYSCFCKLQYSGGIVYCDADMRKDRDTAAQAQTAVEIFVQWRPHFFGVEEEIGAASLINDIHRVADDRSIAMAVIPMATDQIQKEVRIRRLTPYLARRMFRFKNYSEGAKLLLEQLRSFPAGQHDDGPDAMEYGIRLLNMALAGQVTAPMVVAR